MSARKRFRHYENLIEKNNPPVLVPMESRTVSSMYNSNRTTNFEYNFCHGGLSWTIPYVTGLFAIARQINSVIKLKDFYKIAQNSGRDFKIDGKSISKIIQPKELVKTITNSI